MTRANRQSDTNVQTHNRAKDDGQRYRFEHLSLPLVLKDLRFSNGDPGPGDRAPQFDLPTVDGGRFRSSDLSDTRPRC